MQSEPDADSRTVRYQEILAVAAGAAGDADLDAFMHAAWAAFVGARPGLREHLEQVQMLAQLDSLRAKGKMPEA